MVLLFWVISCSFLRVLAQIKDEVLSYKNACSLLHSFLIRNWKKETEDSDEKKESVGLGLTYETAKYKKYKMLKLEKLII